VLSVLCIVCTGPDSSLCKVLLSEARQAVTARSAAPDSSSNEVRVAILVNHRVGWGERIAITGQDKVLGSWQPGESLPLSWSEGDVWRAEVGLPPGVHEFKVSSVTGGGERFMALCWCRQALLPCILSICCCCQSGRVSGAPRGDFVLCPARCRCSA
jgi:hypothetical protein